MVKEIRAAVAPKVGVGDRKKGHKGFSKGDGILLCLDRGARAFVKTHGTEYLRCGFYCV